VLNEVLYEADSDRFVTTVCARLRPDPPSGAARMDVAVAGHPAPVVIRTDGTVEPVDARGVLCGVLPEAEYAETTVWLHRGDTVLLFTDGIYEARGPAGFYGMDRLYDLLPTLAGAGPDAVCEAVEDSVVSHLAGGQHDDMALLAVTCGAGA
ncbi:MAG: PP2C family protein-serine/threonine phosphatase, partial [Sciscionella sp.]